MLFNNKQIHLQKTYAEFSQQSIESLQGEFYQCFEEFTNQFFSELNLPTPIIELTSPIKRNAWGEYLRISPSGIEFKINLQSKILTGEHRSVSSLKEHEEGRKLLIKDVLLRQVVRLVASVTLPEDCSAKEKKAHFLKECNRIGDIIGLSRVGSGSKKGTDAHLPNCSFWPLNVRPEGYYQGAWPLSTPTRTRVRNRQSPQQRPLLNDEKNNPNFYIPEAYHKWMKNLVELFGADEALKVIFYGGKEVSHSDKDRFVEVRSDLQNRLSEIENLIVNQKDEFEIANAPVDAFMKT